MLGLPGGSPTSSSRFGQVEEEFAMDDVRCRFEENNFTFYELVGSSCLTMLQWR